MTLSPEQNELFSVDYVGIGVLADLAPAPGRCHEQVECWLAVYSGDTPVRGWLADGGNDA